MSSEPDASARSKGRIPMADAGPLSDRQREVQAGIVAGKRKRVVGPLRAALHSPELADRWQSLGEFLRFDSSLPAQLSELAIITTGRFWNCQVEWVIHSRIAAEAGIAAEVIEAVRTARSPEIDDKTQQAVYEFTRELLSHGQVSDDVYAALRRDIGVTALVELTALVGYYSMVAMTLNAHNVPLPADEPARLLDLPSGNDLNGPTVLPQSTRVES